MPETIRYPPLRTSFETWIETDRNVLISNDEHAEYQWIDCDNGNKPIEGETFLTYSAKRNGHYAVIVSKGACADTSAVFEVLGTVITDPSVVASLPAIMLVQ